MARRHALAVASILCLAAVLGAVALGRTLALGAGSAKAQDAAVAARTRQLDRFEASLRRQLAAAKAGAGVQAQPTTPAGAQTQRVLYVRPEPVVVPARGTGEHDDDDQAEHDDRGEGEWDD